MIITLTLNPAADKTIVLPTLEIGQVQRVRESHLDPAGKGINVSRIVDRLGYPTLAFGFLAGDIGSLIQRALVDEGVQSYFIQVPGQTRLNVTIFDRATGTGTSFYDRGPSVDVSALDRLQAQVKQWLCAARVLVLAGSLPDDVASTIYADYIRLAAEFGVKTILDADGEVLRDGLAARPYLVKPNTEEAQRLTGRSIDSLEEAVEAAHDIQAMGAAVVVLSMGAEGLICVDGERVWQARPPDVKRRSTVGSGDSLVAGLALSVARDQDISEGLRLGSAAGAATAAVPGTALGSAADIERLLSAVEVSRLA